MEFRVCKNEDGTTSKYKLCCGNCKNYLGRDVEGKVNKSNCASKDKILDYITHCKFMKKYYPSDLPCKYFEFEPKIEYGSKNAFIKAARLLKNHCKNTKCGNCEFYEKPNKCRLETKRDYNFNTVPRDWNV